MRVIAVFLALVFGLSCQQDSTKKQQGLLNFPYAIVLGIAQDAGYPQAGTKNNEAWEDLSKRRHASCLGIVDPQTGERWLIEATPDFKDQLHQLDKIAPVEDIPGLSGIFLTHAHIGHYTGLMHVGHEVIGAPNVPVYSMPRMGEFLRTNGPWDQLVRYKNIKLMSLESDKPVRLNSRLTITPFLVPHREEYSETVGYRVDGPNRSIIFIPDINKWELWDEWGTRVEDIIAEVDVAYLDGSFYQEGEIPGRDMSEIPHPFISESMKRFASLPAQERSKIRFIHLNHTNPAIHDNSEARNNIERSGYGVAEELEVFQLQ
jgi:pyrroloquinoline quinone biosynthesis protein B